MAKKEKTTVIGLDELELTNNDLFVRKDVIDLDKDARVIVYDTHTAILLKDGRMQETLESGDYPLFDKKRGLFRTEKAQTFALQLVYISHTARLQVYWGTRSQFDMRDDETGIPVRVGASGEFEVRVKDPRKFYLELIGADKHYTLENLKERLQGRMINIIEPAIATTMREKKISYCLIAENKQINAENVFPKLKQMFLDDYGLEMVSFIISKIIIDEDAKEAIEAEFEARKEKERADADEAARRAREAEEEAARRESTEYWIELWEKVKDRQADREMLLRRLESENYEKYLEVCKIIGWENGQTSSASAGNKFCRHCGAALVDGAMFCPQCGQRAGDEKIKCRKCGRENAYNALFCCFCGEKLS